MSVREQALKAKEASAKLALASTEQKNSALEKIAEKMKAAQKEILEANSLDVKKAEEAGTSKALIDRLSLNEKRIEGIISSLKEVVGLKDPVGVVLDEWKRPNGLKLKKISVPFGTIAIIFEARPNVTIDAAALCLKSGNSVVLRGSSSTINSNKILVKLMKKAVEETGLPADCIQLLESKSRSEVTELLSLHGIIDVAIPRGGKGLIEAVVQNSKVPVIETGTGICHVFVDDSANLEMAEKIVINAKTSRPSVCNAAEKLLVHEKIAEKFLPRIAEKFAELGVEIRADEKSFALLKELGLDNVKEMSETDLQTEFLDLVMSFVVVKDLNEAILHINCFGSKHSEAIISETPENVQRFFREVDAANVFHNASTRFSDGGQYGFGMEMGISTQKLHARGPFGLKELTSYKYLIEGNGQVRE